MVDKHIFAMAQLTINQIGGVNLGDDDHLGTALEIRDNMLVFMAELLHTILINHYYHQ